jgi:hypothetical protein
MSGPDDGADDDRPASDASANGPPAPLPPSVEALTWLASWAGPLADPAFEFGHWIPARPLPDGTLHVPWYELSPEAERFVREASGHGFVVPFDWMAWSSSEDGQRLLGHPEAVASAAASDLVRLLTAYVRGERFGDGTLEGALESGMLVAIARRARGLVSQRG